MARRRLLPIACTALLALAATATASDPESGKVSRSAPKTSWTGQVSSFQSWQLYNQGQYQCMPPSCDTFELEVADSPSVLTIVISSADSASYVEVVKPDGTSQLFGSAETVKAVIKSPANGTYTINTAQNEQTQATHQGSAELTFPAAPAPAPAAPAPTAAPAPASQPATALRVLAKKVRTGRSMKVAVDTLNGGVTGLKAVLLKGSRKLATGSLARLEGRGTLKLKARKAPKPGRYNLKLTATDTQGRAVAVTEVVTLRR